LYFGDLPVAAPKLDADEVEGINDKATQKISDRKDDLKNFPELQLSLTLLI
jgi:hypothetical protein